MFMSTIATSTGVVIRRARPDDIAVCASICLEAFQGINRQHGYPPEIPNLEVATEIISRHFQDPAFYCVVAESEGRLLGSNCLDERSPHVAGIGPITVTPETQEKDIGRALMRDVLRRAEEKNYPAVRLVQSAFNNRSLSLYTKLGFEVREPLALMNGPALNHREPGFEVRPCTENDLDACDRLCRDVHGHDRRTELSQMVSAGAAQVVEHGGRIVGCCSILGFMGFAVAESNLALQALIGAAREFAGPGFLVPTRNSALFRWCLEQGLRVIEPLNLMSLGLYNEPKGAFLPSITY